MFMQLALIQKILLVSIAILVAGAISFFTFQKKLGQKEVAPTLTPTPEAEVQVTMNGIIEKAKVKLAEYLGISKEQIEVISSKQIDWSDTSLGAPEEGMLYAQVITPGYKIVMKVEEVEYAAHTDKEGKQIVLVKEGKRLR